MRSQMLTDFVREPATTCRVAEIEHVQRGGIDNADERAETRSVAATVTSWSAGAPLWVEGSSRHPFKWQERERQLTPEPRTWGGL